MDPNARKGNVRHVVRWSLVIIWSCCAAAAYLDAENLTTVKTLKITHSYTNQPVPRYSNGYLLAFDPPSQKIRAYKDVVLQMSATVSIPGASSVRITDVACSPDGVVAATVTAAAAGGDGVSSAIVWMDQAGGITRIVRLSGFGARRLAFAPDGRLWVLGREFDAAYNDAPRYDMLRRYSRDGVLERSALPNTAVVGAPHPSDGFINVNGGRILVHFPGAQVFVALTTGGQLLSQWKVSAPANVELTGAALDRAGEIYVSGLEKGDSPRPATALYRIDTQTGRLAPVTLVSFDPRQQFAALLGSDSEGLVFYSKPPVHLRWVQ